MSKISLGDLDTALGCIKDCDRALKGGYTPSWLESEIRKARETAIKKRRAEFVKYLREQGIEIIEEEV